MHLGGERLILPVTMPGLRGEERRGLVTHDNLNYPPLTSPDNLKIPLRREENEQVFT